MIYKKKGRKEVYLCNRYGITLKQYNMMFDYQNGSCAICEKHQLELDQMLSVDHCHITGKIRGLLCPHCNHGLGKFKDDITILEKAKKYLEVFS